MKKVHWMGSTLKDLKKFPVGAREEAGYAIYLAQCGDRAVTAVPLVGFGGAKVLEVLIDEQGDAYRAVYTVKFEKAVYGLHAFQKKSKRGIATPRADISLVRDRLRLAEAHYKAHYEQQEQNHGRRSKDRRAERNR